MTSRSIASSHSKAGMKTTGMGSEFTGRLLAVAVKSEGDQRARVAMSTTKRYFTSLLSILS